MQISTRLDDDHLEGLYQEWYEDGQPRLEGEFDDEGRRRGRWTWYYPSGLLERVQHFSEGKKDGAFVQLYPAEDMDEQTLSRLGTFEVGVKHGLFLEWDESGKRVSRTLFCKDEERDCSKAERCICPK